MRVALVPAALLVLTACPVVPVEEGQTDGLRTLAADAVSNGDGIATWTWAPPAGAPRRAARAAAGNKCGFLAVSRLA